MRALVVVSVTLFIALAGASAHADFSDGFESGDVSEWSASVGIFCVDECALVQQTGCTPLDKCAFAPTCPDPLLGCARCAEDGTVGAGGACIVGGGMGFDDCLAGLFCDRGMCTEMCHHPPDTCPVDSTCIGIGGSFDGQDLSVCKATCDVFAQDCINDDGCYLLLGREGYPTACLLPEPEPSPPDGCGTGLNRPGIQGECCSYLNTCDTGYGCLQPDAPDFDHLVCARFCDPTGTVGFDDCNPLLGPDYWCVGINRFYSSVPDLPDYYGFCAAESIWGPPQCYNGVQDPDEDGIDCCIEPGGNPNCPCVFECPPHPSSIRFGPRG